MTGTHGMVGDSTATGVFGATLRRHRTILAWSQEDLAEASRVAARTISDLERGVAVRPSLDYLHGLPPMSDRQTSSRTE